MKKSFVALIVAIMVIVSIVGLSFVQFIPLLSPTFHNVASGDKSVVMSGPSMQPTVKQGATVYYKSVPYDSLKVNDIIIYNNSEIPSGMFILARITQTNSDGLVTKGDFIAAEYPWKVNATMLIGKVTEIHNL
jgi:signal peptidase I